MCEGNGKPRPKFSLKTRRGKWRLVCQQVIPVRRWDVVELRVSLQGMMISHHDSSRRPTDKHSNKTHSRGSLLDRNNDGAGAGRTRDGRMRGLSGAGGHHDLTPCPCPFARLTLALLLVLMFRLCNAMRIILVVIPTHCESSRRVMMDFWRRILWS